MTYRELCLRLERAGIENAEWDAALLLERFCRVNPTLVRLTPEEDYSSPALEAAVQRREARYPLQYLLGEWTFYRQTYEVSPACLIPRSDTEILVEEAIRLLPRGAFFADLCTGSGCIAISVLANRRDCRAVACDICAGALETAKRNAERNGVADRIEFLPCDVLTEEIDREFDAVISNPPYIRSDVIPTLSPEVQKEPMRALDGGDDGMIFYRRIVKDYKGKLKANGFLLFETGYDQRDEIIKVAEKNSLLCECICDYEKNHRGAVMRKNTN